MSCGYGLDDQGGQTTSRHAGINIHLTPFAGQTRLKVRHLFSLRKRVSIKSATPCGRRFLRHNSFYRIINRSHRVDFDLTKKDLRLKDKLITILKSSSAWA